jgi:methylglutaconyl-CoA hydratase
MSSSVVLTEIRDRVGIITLNRPDKRNALNPEMVEQLYQAFSAFFDHDDVKVLKLRAEGDVFCAGADLQAIKKLKSASYQENLEDSKALAKLFSCIYHGAKPVIAVVHGHAIAGGCGLATVCDIVLAAHSAKLGYTETRIGFVPAIVAQFLLRKVGGTHARNLLLSGSLISADEAARIGLVTESIAESGFNERVDEVVEKLLYKTSGQALQSTKALLNKVSDMSVDEALEYASGVNARARGSDDCQRGIQAFLNKEKIKW